MPDTSKRTRLPDYDNPPVVETVLGVQFDRLPSFKIAHLGAFWNTLDTDEWPLALDAPLLPPQFEQFDKTAPWAKGFHLQLTQGPTCRLQIKNNAGDRMIQLQNDRLHFNWLGESGDPYPRYDEVRKGFDWALNKFREFVGQQNLGDLQPNQWEVTYLNHIPQGSVWNTPKDWNFFRPLAGVFTVDGLVEGESFGGEWHFVIPDRRGRLHVQWNYGLKSVDNEAQNEVVRLDFTARGPIENNGDELQPVSDGLDLGRKTIVASFKELMSDDANKHWGLHNAND